jgi:4-amino-4-deoxy-L-arabinose transferase-like glycosyltransferase
VAWRPLVALGGVVAAVLVATSGRYGYHGDELYFLQAGRHLAWGYPDQPPLTPLLARVVAAIAPGSVTVLRLPSALAAGAVVVLTGPLAGELGAGRGGQLLAAGCVAVSTVLLVAAHMLQTTTFDLLTWTTLSWLVVRVLRGGDDPRLWVLIGAVAGIGLLNKALVAFLVAGLGLALLVAGPREVLRSRWPWIGALVALVLWAPNLAWQAGHGWPQLALSRAIAAGSSGTSVSRLGFLLYQLVLISPVLVPVWLAGLWRLLRDPALVRVRALGWTYLILLVVFLVTGGKHYYLAGLYPVLLAAGAAPTLDWLGRARTRLRSALLAGAFAVSAAVSTVIALPVVPLSALHATPIVAINHDAGATVGWPQLAATVADVYAGLPAADRTRTVLLTQTYAEAGALDRYGPALGLPRSYSGHNGYGLWGPPSDTGGPVIAVGVPRERLQRWFGSVHLAARLDNGYQVTNETQGQPVWVCRRQRRPWAAMWGEVVYLA